MPPMHQSRRRKRASGWAFLWKMLLEYNQFPEHAGTIQETLRERFEKDVAILVLDMSGFSRLTDQYGVLHYLAMNCRMSLQGTDG